MLGVCLPLVWSFQYLLPALDPEGPKRQVTRPPVPGGRTMSQNQLRVLGDRGRKKSGPCLKPGLAAPRTQQGGNATKALALRLSSPSVPLTSSLPTSGTGQMQRDWCLSCWWGLAYVHRGEAGSPGLELGQTQALFGRGVDGACSCSVEHTVPWPSEATFSLP